MKKSSFNLMRNLILYFCIIILITGCKKSSSSPVSNIKKFQITINSSDALKVTMYDNDSLLVFKGSIIAPFEYDFIPKPGDQIRFNIIYSQNIAITESYDGKIDHADLAIQVAPKSGNGGTVQYVYPIPQ